MSKSKEHLFKTDIYYRTYRILHLAKKYGWVLKKSDAEKFEFEYKDGSQLYVHYSKLNCTTLLQHPRWGRTILTRKGNLTQKLIEAIFRNPRAHMPKRIISKYITEEQ